ncbi:MAG: hypothetical protein RLZZ324_644 [Candidatus Parcubacteria bacterium]|jgi:hypothetical protein
MNPIVLNDPVIRPETYRENPAYMLRDSVGQKGAKIVGRPGCYGARWQHGPLVVERYTGDVPPVLEEDRVPRLVVWQPLHPAPRPKRWWYTPPGMSVGMTGYAPVIKGEAYDKRWSSNVRRQAAKFRKSGWIIREVTPEEYKTAYDRCVHQDFMLRALFAATIDVKIQGHPGLVRLYGAAPSQDARIEAGFICVDVPETMESQHYLSFICKPALEVGAGSGLMDHWFRTGIARGVRYFDFGIFWRKGDPKSWKGNSRFKSSFGTIMMDYPSPYMRWYRGRGL